MPIPSPLHPFDEHVVTAKAMAFSVLARHEQFWTDEQLPLLAELETTIGRAELLRKVARENVALQTFLEDFVANIESSVGPLVKKSPQPFDAYLSELQSVRNDWPPIAQQVQRWFDNLKAIGTDYLERFTTEKPKLPPIRLEQSASPEHCTLRGIGGVTDEDGDGRCITLFYDRETFGKESFLSIPYVLSHEFWCHGLSRLVSKKTGTEEQREEDEEGESDELFGTDPSNGFEEGWMDFVQLEILGTELRRFIGMPPFEALFHSRSASCQSERNSKKGNAVISHGVTVADRFYTFLEQSFDDLTARELKSVFLRTSLDLNLLSHRLSDKPGLVINLGHKLGVSAANERARPSVMRDRDLAILSMREQLRLDLSVLFVQTGFPAYDLLKLLKLRR
jgi:hypothetical protein